MIKAQQIAVFKNMLSALTLSNFKLVFYFNGFNPYLARLLSLWIETYTKFPYRLMGDGVIQYVYLQDSTYLAGTLNSCHMFKSEVLFRPLLHLITELAFTRHLVVEIMCNILEAQISLFKLLNLNQPTGSLLQCTNTNANGLQSKQFLRVQKVSEY